jgi:superfamily II DNA or RNA helicase
MSASSSETVLATLKNFQKRTVEHVFERLYTPEGSTRRFLVADEVGMGKTLVAKGVISKAVEYLNGVDSVQRIDIIYICSNSAIARQNIKKLNIFRTDTKHPNTRITMLAAQAHDLNKETPGQ